jgi:hypothetical protein
LLYPLVLLPHVIQLLLKIKKHFGVLLFLIIQEFKMWASVINKFIALKRNLQLKLQDKNTGINKIKTLV